MSLFLEMSVGCCWNSTKCTTKHVFRAGLRLMLQVEVRQGSLVGINPPHVPCQLGTRLTESTHEKNTRKAMAAHGCPISLAEAVKRSRFTPKAQVDPKWSNALCEGHVRHQQTEAWHKHFLLYKRTKGHKKGIRGCSLYYIIQIWFDIT